MSPPARPLWARLGALFLPSWALLVLATLTSMLRDLMDASGLPGFWIHALVNAPILALLVRHRARLRDPALRPTLALAALSLLGALASEDLRNGVAKCLALVLGVAWAVLLLERPQTWRVLSLGGTGLCLVGVALRALGVGIIPGEAYFLPVLSLFVGLRKAPEGTPEAALVPKVFAALAQVLLLGLVAASTFRAAVLGTAAGLLVAVPRSFRAGTLTVVFAFAALGVALAGPQAQGGYTRDVDRGDLRARFETLSEDRLSRRADIWEALADDASEGATWVYVGVGLGDLDHYLGALCPTLAQRGRDGRSTLHSHNTLLEVWLGLGLPGLLCLAWCILSLARRLRWGSPEAGLGVAMLVISSGNVTLYDLTGGCQAFGVLLALGARTDAGRQGRGVR